MRALINKIIQKVEKLPTISTVAFEVIRLCSDKEVPIPKLVKIIAGDQSLTSQILKVANSSYFNYPRTIYSLDRAIIILGFNLLRDISVSLAVFSLFKGFKTKNYDLLRNIWRHSLYTGISCKVLAQNYEPESKENLYIGGLLHDIGKLVLITTMGKDYDLLIEKAEQETISMVELESKFLGVNHSEVGAGLIELWNLPESLVSIAKFHHCPREYRSQDKISRWIQLVYLGDIFAHLLESKQNDTKDLIRLYPDFQNNFSLAKSEIGQMLEEIKSDIDRIYIDLVNASKGIIELRKKLTRGENDEKQK